MINNVVIPVKTGIQFFMKQYYVYILASKKHGTLCIGVTSDLVINGLIIELTFVMPLCKKSKSHF